MRTLDKSSKVELVRELLNNHQQYFTKDDLGSLLFNLIPSLTQKSLEELYDELDDLAEKRKPTSEDDLKLMKRAKRSLKDGVYNEEYLSIATKILDSKPQHLSEKQRYCLRRFIDAWWDRK